jgi:glyoxylase-like metal-dependent hydrolase (beta-lactamase superfamily II)
MQRFRIGAVEAVALVDTIQAYPADSVYPAIGDVSRFAGYLDGEGRYALNFGCFLLRDGGKTTLVDTGWGPEFDGKLLNELSAAGVAPASVDAVIFTHLHGDHTGWNFDRATGKPIFPNARYLVPKADWDHYRAENPPPDSFTRDVLPLEALKQMDLISGDFTISPSLTAIPTPGHTPGHTSVVVASGGERGFILGDVVISPIDAEEPGLANAFDTDGAVAAATRKAVIERLIGDGSLVGASHLPAPGLGRFVREAGKTRWAPL